MSDKCRTDPECYWKGHYDIALGAWHEEIEKRVALERAARALAEAVAEMRVPQNVEEAAVQVTFTIGPALRRLQKLLGPALGEPEVGYDPKAEAPYRAREVAPAITVSAPPTHRCKVCGALWRLNPAEPEKYPPTHPFHKETWSVLTPSPGKCCDNVPMGNQIEAL